MINFLFYTVLPPGAPKLTKLTNLMILHSSFRFDRTVFWSKLMMSTMLFTTNLNTMTNSRRCNVFSLRASKIDQKIILSVKWLNFATSEDLGVKIVYPREFIMKFKVVHNVVSDNFHFDHKAVGSNLSKLFFFSDLSGQCFNRN